MDRKAIIQQKISRLSPEKRRIMEKRLQGTLSAATPAREIPRRVKESPAPLSFAQQRLWFLDQLMPGSPLYIEPVALRLTGALNVDVLHQSLNEIIRRHESLRTTFATIEGESVQVIAPAVSLPLPLIDLQALSAAEREVKVSLLTQEEAQLPFDLSEGLLIRVSLVRLAPEEHLAFLTMHHIISDIWSMGVFIRELTVLYDAFSQGQPSPLPELPIQYGDFADWQRQWFTGGVAATHIAYWKEKLVGIPPVLELPTDRPHPPVQTFQGAFHRVEIDSGLTGQLRALSQQSGTTLYMTLFAAFTLLLFRYTNQEDIAVGSPVANRSHKETEPLIGFFVNMLVLCTNLSGNPTFKDLLNRVRQTALDAYAHQDMPFEELVEALHPERSLSHTPFFQTVFVLNRPVKNVELRGLQIRPLEIERESAKFDLTLLLEEIEENGLKGHFEYNVALFDASTIERMTTHFQILLKGIVANPEQRIAELPLLSATERRQVLEEWNHRQQTYPPSVCLHQRFEAQAAHNPDSIALIDEDQHVTYQELNRRANQLANCLRESGVQSDMLVGLCVERSLEMIVAILGILKAGGAYLPLDLAYPKERLAFMLKDAGVSVLVTQQHLVTGLPEQKNLHILCLDTDWQEIARQSKHNPDIAVTPDHLAYVIYTSGSTGQPKGVQLTHYHVVRLFEATQDWYHFDRSDVWALFHSNAFDFSVWEIWGALLYGGRLAVVPYVLSRAPSAFYDLLCREQVTVLNQTPSAFRQLIQAEEYLTSPGTLQLRYVIFGGEALDIPHLRPWFERHGDQKPQLVNMYGITETTVHVTYRPLTLADLDSPASVIGCAIPDLQLYILDPYLQPVPIGVLGELYVGGAGVARGYLKRPELTQEKFIPNPFSVLSPPNLPRQGGGTLRENSSPPPMGGGTPRLYKTGDVARYLANGDIEYFGRIDQQVKIRGFRIELGEIETALSTSPDVRSSVVIAKKDTPDHNRLIAYIVPERDQTVSISALRESLKATLPDYMIPAAFVMLEQIPLTPNGKIDRRALPEPDHTRPDLKDRFLAPRGSTEELFAQIWAEVLGVEQVGIHDNFFDLGGDSIQSIKVLAKAKKAGLDVSLQQLFQYQTIAELARCTMTADLIATPYTEAFDLIPSQERAKLPENVEDAYPLAALQAGMLFHSEYTSDTAVYHDVFSYYVRAPFDPKALRSAIQSVIQRHPVLRTAFALSGFHEPLQLVYARAEAPLNVTDWSHLFPSDQETALESWIATEIRHHFDWTIPPLIRFQVHRRSTDTFNLTLSFHHTILDGWSVAQLLTELFQSYLLLLGKSETQLPPPPEIHFRDFIALERLTIQAEEQRQYWLRKLQNINIITLSRWPQSYRSGRTGQLKHKDVTISAELSERLLHLSKTAEVPVKTLLLAGHLRVLSILGSQPDVLTGLVSNGRPEETGGERVLGLFLNTLPFRVTLEGGSWNELIRQTFDAEREVLPYRRYPFAELQKEFSGQDLYETIFNFTHFHVYQDILSLGEIEPLGFTFFEQTNFPLFVNFNLDVGGSALSLSLGYDAGELCEEQVDGIGHYYVNVLDAMTAQPEARYEQISVLSPEERQTFLTEWNVPPRAYPHELCLHHLFEAQVEQTPEAVAVVSNTEEITYQELNRQANQLAHHLQSLGVGAESLVGVCMERSIPVVVALLGILKAGGAYVPLDPNYPAERLRFMLKDARVAVLLTQNSLCSGLPESQARVVCLDRDWEFIAQEKSHNPVSAVHADNLAYVLYTSGSTGKPKGVAIEHHSPVIFVNWAKEIFQPEEIAGVLASTTLCFDLSVFEVFVPLSWGGTLMLIENILHLPEFPAKHNVTLINTVPSAMAELLRMNGVPASVRVVNLAGEALKNTLVQQIYQQDTVQKVFNLYGPSEDTTYSIFALMIKGNRDSPLIGRPIVNTHAYILDAYLQLCPVGVAGELHLGGDGLARGYLNRPELTQAKFIPDPFAPPHPSPKERETPLPFGEGPGVGPQRLYKTGDLARYLPDGSIDYLGRVDHQIKLRGFRIELGEIETALSAHPHIRDNVVIVREDSSGDKRLVAYVVGDMDVSELRGYLKQTLPEYMLPAVFIPLEALPLTPNGKIDRQALPLVTQGDSEEKYARPRNSIEDILSRIWTDVLDCQGIGIYANFFDIGGHSLLATQVISRVRDVFQIELPIRTLFDLPTIAEMGAQIESVCYEHKAQVMPVTPVQRTGVLPLSFAQQRLWFLEQLEGPGAAYNIPVAIRITGQFQIPIMEQMLNEVLRRHEALRTTFSQVAGTPVQVIAPVSPITLPIVNVQTFADGEQPEAVIRLAQEEAQKPFDLSQGPLFRATLLRLGAEEHVLLVTMHHIVSDGWSIGAFIKECLALYEAFAAGQPSPLPELPVQYADFAYWQRQWLSGELLQTQLDYWRSQLANAPVLLELPTDRPRPPLQTFHGGAIAFEIDEQLTGQLRTLGDQAGTSLFMTLYAAFAVLLYRYTGQEDILVGMPVANRTRKELEPLIGFFVNTLVLRADLSANPAFHDLLRQVRQVTLEAYSHQDIPFEQLVEELEIERSLSHSPLFQVMLVMQNTPRADLHVAGLTISPLEIDSAAAKFDFTLSMTETSQGLRGDFEYNRDLFDAKTIARLAEHFRLVLQGIVANSQARIAQLPLLSDAERHTLLVEWNQTQQDYPHQERRLHHWFEAQVDQTPDEAAVIFENRRLSYCELNRSANQLAHYLQGLGVGPDVLVGVFMERSLEMVISLYGILKAGGAYVPLEPTYPKERITFMTADANVAVILTQHALLPELPAHQARVLCVDTDWQSLSQESEENPAVGLTGEHLAYVIYTSGSTGKPKGAMNTHEGICNRLLWMQETYQLTTADRILQKTPFSFDVSVWEFFWPLMVGATLVVAQPEGHKDRSYLVRLIAEQQITTLHFVPPMLQVFLEDPHVEMCTSLRRVICSGEALPYDLQEKFFARLNAELHNLYGPTEAAIDVTFWQCTPESDLKIIPIGRPIANTQIYILDQYLQPVPVSVYGELHLGGVNLARGYLNRPELTQAKFIPNPFTMSNYIDHCHRLYKTGDLVRYLPDGNVEYHGRLDQQVKLRGFRIELGEIETVLAASPQVRETVVIVREDQPGDSSTESILSEVERLRTGKRLIAYVVGEGPAADLQAHLRKTLPEYMIPAAFVFLEALPLTPNGKIDRRALPEPGITELEKDYVAPRNETEATLAAIWNETLHRDNIGIYENFFELGGHSLLATQVIARIYERFQIELSLRTLFEAPLIAGLAEHIDTILWAAHPSEITGDQEEGEL